MRMEFLLITFALNLKTKPNKNDLIHLSWFAIVIQFLMFNKLNYEHSLCNVLGVSFVDNLKWHRHITAFEVLSAHKTL